MDYDNDFGNNEYELHRGTDPAQSRVADKLRKLFDEKREAVFYSRQLEVMFEDEFFHWITSRALRQLAIEGVIRSEKRALGLASSLNIYWHHSFRYYRRTANELVRLVGEYSDPNVGGAIGIHAELLVLEGFAKKQFLLLGRDTHSFNGRTWMDTDHDLDFIIEQGGRVYGVEVKNTLQYIEHDELTTKLSMCHMLGIYPVFVVHMLPKVWIKEIVESGGFALILKHQLYPWSHRDLARRIRQELHLPVDAPRKGIRGWHNGEVQSAAS